MKKIITLTYLFLSLTSCVEVNEPGKNSNKPKEITIKEEIEETIIVSECKGCSIYEKQLINLVYTRIKNHPDEWRMFVNSSDHYYITDDIIKIYLDEFQYKKQNEIWIYDNITKSRFDTYRFNTQNSEYVKYIFEFALSLLDDESEINTKYNRILNKYKNK